MLISKIRRSISVESKQKTSKGGGKGSWRDEFRIPNDSKTSDPSIFIFMKGEYEDPSAPQSLVEVDPATGKAKPVTNLYFRGKRHKKTIFANGRKQYPEIVCSKGSDPYNPQPCAGCAAKESGDNTAGASDFYAFGIYHLAFYHGHPIVQRDGSLMLRDNGEPVVGYDECIGRDCNYCRVMQNKPTIGQGFPNFPPNSITTVYGRRRYIKVGRGHLENVSTWEKGVGSICGTCRSSLQLDGFVCPNCDSVLIDMENDPRSKDEIVELVSNHKVMCSKCNVQVWVEEATYCPSCAQEGKEWVTNHLTDVIIFASKSGEGTNSTLAMKQFMSIEDFERHPQNKNIIPFLGGKPLRQYISENATPYNFSETFAPIPYEEQAKRLGLQPGGGGPVGGMPYPTAGAPASFHQPRPNYGK